MKLYVFAIRDEKVNSFMAPMFARSEGEARRSFTDEVNRASADNILYRHPADFTLYSLGLFETDSASFELSKLPVMLVSGAAVKTDDDAPQARLQGVN